MSDPRVTVALHAAEVGGPLRSLEQALGWLAKSTELELLVPDRGELPATVGGLGATVVRGPYGALATPVSVSEWARAGPRLWREVSWFRGRLRARRPRLALAVTSTLPAFVLAARLERVPCVLWVGELWESRGPIRGGLGGMVLGRQARVASAVIACSEAVARQLAPSVEVITIHPPIASHAGGDGEGFRRRHGIPGEVQLVAAVGSITPTRGQDQLLRAVAALRREHPDLHCVIEGEPFLRRRDLEFSAELDRLVGELGLREVVVRTSRTASLSDLYAAADLIVSPSTTHPESFGRVPLEAATAGTPSVLTAVGAIPELHRDGVSAVLVAPGDVDGLAGAIARVLDDPALARRLTIGGAELAARIADPERSLAAFQALIEPRISG